MALDLQSLLFVKPRCSLQGCAMTPFLIAVRFLGSRSLFRPAQLRSHPGSPLQFSSSLSIPVAFSQLSSARLTPIWLALEVAWLLGCSRGGPLAPVGWSPWFLPGCFRSPEAASSSRSSASISDFVRDGIMLSVDRGFLIRVD